MLRKLFLLLVVMLPLKLWAQNSVSGKVYDFDNKVMPLQNVNVRNITNNQVTKTKAAGQFTLQAKTGDVLVLSLSGYHSDTLYLINLAPKTIYLPGSSTSLKEVEILSAKINPSILAPDPEAEKAKRITTDGLRGKKNNDRAGGLVLTLGYGKYKKQQEKLKDLEERDRYDAEINAVFTEEYVSNITKLKGEDLKNFMSLYRPSAVLVKSERPFNYAFYTSQAYHAWLKIPAEQRKIAPMPKLKKSNK